MKAKFFWGITIFLSMVMLLGCSNEVVLEQEQSKVQNSELIKEYSTLISQNKYGLLADLVLSDQQEMFPNWKNLSEEELESVMKLVADEFVKLGGTNNLNKIPNWSSKDDYDLNLATSLGVNALVRSISTSKSIKHPLEKFLMSLIMPLLKNLMPLFVLLQKERM